jgi:XTP/dITP diphosphohydrolase
MLHIVFLCQDRKKQMIADVCNEFGKLIHRHPHIYGDTVVKDEEVKRNWEKQKLKEGRKSVLEGVPKSCRLFES